MSQSIPSTESVKGRVRIVEATEEDIPALLAISHAAFENDAHTRFKMHEKGADISVEMPKEMFHGGFDKARGVTLKAVDGEEIVGWAGWGYYDLNGEKPANGEPSVPLDAPVDYKIDPSAPPLDRLKSITSGHLFTMYDRVCIPGKKVIFCRGISVSPTSQSRGIGSLLISEAAKIADEHHASMWVHLSDNPRGVRAFEKNGFVEIGRVEVDLDEYKQKAMPEGKDKWGRYTMRCLRREEKQ